MLVKDLIKILQEQCNPELPVYVENPNTLGEEAPVVCDFVRCDGYTLLAETYHKQCKPHKVLANIVEKEEL